MADFIAIDWEQHRVFGVEASTSRSGTQIRSTFEFEWPATLLDPQDAKERGEWLRGKLKEAGISATQAIVSLPRENTVIRPLDLPEAPADDIPDLVRFQAATKLTGSIDDLVIDYLPLPRFAATTGIHVLMATVVRSRIQEMRTILDAAGIEMVSLGTSAGATAELVTRVEKARKGNESGLTLVVSKYHSRVELALIQGTHLLFSHSTQVDANDVADSNRAIYTEISRSRISLQRWVESTDIDQAWIVGTADGSDELKEFLEGRLNCNIEYLDPLEAPGVKLSGPRPEGDHSVFAGPIGLLLGHESSEVEKLDFLSPRRRPEVKDTRLQKIILAAVAVVAVAAAGLWLYSTSLSDLEGQITKVNEKQAEIAEVVKRGENNIAAAQSLNYWAEGNVNWLDTLRQLNTTMAAVNRDEDSGDITSASHRVYLTNINLSDAGRDAIARVDVDGYARTGNDVEALRENLRGQQMKVYPSETKWSTQDQQYLREFPLAYEGGVRTVERPQSNRRGLRRRSASR